MNLLMISLHADPSSPAGIGEGGGTHSYVRELLTYFSTKNIRILLITRKCHPSLSEYETISENCNIHRIIIKDENPIDKKEFFTLHDITLQKIEMLLETLGYKPDLIHSIYWNSGQVARMLSIRRKIPFVHTVISNGLRRQKAGMQEVVIQRFDIEKEIFQAAAYIFCITPSEREDLIRLYQIDARKIMVAGRPISDVFWCPSHDDFGMPYRFAIDKNDIGRKSQSKMEYISNYDILPNKWWTKQAFLYCGRLASNKGVDIILKAWYQLKIRYLNLCPALWIVGGSPDEIISLKNKLNDQYNFEYYEESGDLIWWGYLDQRGISTLMLKSHALIMHSSYEPGGRVIIEALASGLPVITTFCGFGADYIHNWYNGFQVPFGNIELLCQVMSLFVKQPYLSNSLGINAKQYIQKILEEWNFYKSHQLVYTMAFTNTEKDFKNSGFIEYCKNYRNYINIYPYFNDIIQSETLKTQLEIVLQEENLQIIPIFTESCAVWTVKSSLEEYEIGQPYTRLLDTSYFYSFIDTKIDKRSDQYKREKYASNLNVNPVLRYVDSYYVYIKKRYPFLNEHQLNNKSILIAIKNLLNSFCNQKISSIQNLLQMFDRNWYASSIDEVKNIYNEYYRKAPPFIYHSYNINYECSLRQLHFILTDQNNIVSKELLFLYFACANYLNINIHNIDVTYGICLEDCSIENIVFDKSRSRCMFRNASSLYWGDVSRMTADFLHSYILFLLINNNNIELLDSNIDIFTTTQDKEKCIRWLFVIVFEKLVLYQSTLQNDKYKKEFKILIQLKNTYIDNKKLPK